MEPDLNTEGCGFWEGNIQYTFSKLEVGRYSAVKVEDHYTVPPLPSQVVEPHIGAQGK